MLAGVAWELVPPEPGSTWSHRPPKNKPFDKDVLVIVRVSVSQPGFVAMETIATHWAGCMQAHTIPSRSLGVKIKIGVFHFVIVGCFLR